MIDAELLVFTLLGASAPDGTRVVPETDTNSLGDLPLWQYNLIGDGQNANGRGLWSFDLSVNIFAFGIDEARRQASLCYDTVWSWVDDPEAAIVPDVGWVSDVSDNSVFSRAGTPDLTGRGVTQYAGSFALALRNN